MSDPVPRRREKAPGLPEVEAAPGPQRTAATPASDPAAVAPENAAVAPPKVAPPKVADREEAAAPNKARRRRRPRRRKAASENPQVSEAPVKRPDDGRGRRPRRRGGRASRPPVERTMLVHADPRGTQIAVLEKGVIVEHYVTRAEDRSIVGSVYLGRVQNVLPGMEASFVDIGESRNGVLYAGEVGIAGDEGEEVPRIETVLKPGQPILVQVTKDPMRSKGARLTAMVSIAGRHLVLVPGANSLGVSRRLPDKERGRLRELAQALRPDGHGLIVRTAAEGTQQTDLERDLERLLESWKEIDQRAKKAAPPALVFEELGLELRAVRDLFNRDVARCVVDDVHLEATLRSYVRQTSPDLDHRIELHDGELPIFEEFRVIEQIRKSLDRRVWLPSGGHIVIDRTEALTVIDVNTGKFVGKSTLEETVFRTNKEAAVEVARQLRLRDIGGIIVIDFIDMEDAGNRDEMIKLFRSELEKDRTRTQVFDISPLGLVQMTRKNVSAGIVEVFSDPCSHCEGRGIIIHDVD